MTKQITLNYNEHCAVLAALELVEAKYENRKKYIYAGLEVEDGEFRQLKATRQHLRTLAKKWNEY